MGEGIFKVKDCPCAFFRLEVGWSGRSGHINSQIIKEEIPDYIGRRFYICGPPAMVEAMKKILSDELALSRENIATENFVGY